MEKESEITSAQGILRECAKTGASGVELAERLGRQAEERPAVRSSLEETADDIRRIVGGRKTKVFGGGKAGEAVQGEQGSSVIDVTAAVTGGPPGTPVVDTARLRDTVDHEEEHERQAPQWNAESVDVGDGRTLTRKMVSEVGAMSVQRTIVDASQEYRDMWWRVTYCVTPEKARETARSGNLLSLAA